MREEEERAQSAPPPVEPEPALVEETPQSDPTPTSEELRARELEELTRIEDESRKAEEAERERRAAEQEEQRRREETAEKSAQAAAARAIPGAETEESEEDARRSGGPSRGKGPARGAAARDTRRPAAPARTRNEPRRRGGGKLTVNQVLNEGGEAERMRSLAAVRRAREKERRAEQGPAKREKIVREVVVPETITVGELANRMAERGADVIKALMRMGMMVTITQSIDPDTAELIVEEFGHKLRRVAEADVEEGLSGAEDAPETLKPRPPVVTIMGHVDHGKTSLLDALRETDVAGREAGGITQHIGAYQVTVSSGAKITFIDTPGHEAFTEMRARGANTTDIVILVVAADDGMMPQTIEAIRHTKAAEVPMIVAVNKCDLPDADPNRVRTDLLQQDVIVEEMGGEIQAINVSAKSGEGLDNLIEAITLQAEIMELKANPDRAAEGSVVEAKLEQGRGAVATVLVQRGTLSIGDVFVTGSEWGRVRALVNERGEQVKQVGPAAPIEVLGLTGAPLAGDDFVVVESEARAREISEYRERTKRDKAQTAGGRGTLEQMLSQIKQGEKKAMPIVIKGDVQGSIEAIAASLEKLAADNDEISVNILHTAVGAVTESDVTLAKASDALIIGFNVRANPQAREMSRRDSVDIRYYSVIYDVIDDVKAALSNMLAPSVRETFMGNAEIREVFSISGVGKVAGCMIVEGMVRRGNKVRLLRDSIVIHEGTLKTLKRFKDEVKEVREGFECGMAFENYDDIKSGDIIEAFETEEIARTL
ncbi:MAG: translation initiation factor IF-2 [Pseudomonadota bacterium]